MNFTIPLSLFGVRKGAGSAGKHPLLQFILLPDVHIKKKKIHLLKGTKLTSEMGKRIFC